MRKRLILITTRYALTRYYMRNMRDENTTVMSIYALSRHDLKYKIARLYIDILNLPFQAIWYGRWKSILNEFEEIIVVNNLFRKNILEYIARKSPYARHIVWNWDAVGSDNYFKIEEKYRNQWEVWSFEADDCEKYGYKYNTQFYVENQDKLDAVYVGDVFICMRDKGRYTYVRKLIDIFKEAKLTVFARIIPDKTTKHHYGMYYGKEMEYEEIIKCVLGAKCILELVKKNQTGLTLRSLESIFYDRKLITNNRKITETDFYNSNNIFVLSDDTNAGEIIEFMNLPYVPVDEKIKKRYTYSSWLSIFDAT